ncbi:hypothetical protein GN244_ATG04319 [Phytophthora infestans]|uniref:Uncharacterized protein n=1 Tax=Phytophthora infestans TaxID=4787 RepID=A0A833WZ96_PHYIN|nr:hypothetical protein GN244_ATG04319 [Phytophthora infestans]KAF4146004.1 hypothetical protein GN958_ATG04827 [Phytophthora infestans]
MHGTGDTHYEKVSAYLTQLKDILSVQKLDGETQEDQDALHRAYSLRDGLRVFHAIQGHIERV